MVLRERHLEMEALPDIPCSIPLALAEHGQAFSPANSLMTFLLKIPNFPVNSPLVLA